MPITLLLAHHPRIFRPSYGPGLSTEFHLFSVIHERKTFNRYRYQKSRAGGNRGMVGVKDTIAPIDFGRFITEK